MFNILILVFHSLLIIARNSLNTGKLIRNTPLVLKVNFNQLKKLIPLMMKYLPYLVLNLLKISHIKINTLKCS